MTYLAAQHHGTKLSANIVRSIEQFEAMRDEWNALFEKACNPSPPLHFDWVSNWLSVHQGRFVRCDDGLRIICCRREGALVAVLPLYLREAMRISDGGRHLRFISTGEYERDEICPDYLDLLSFQETREQCVELAWSQLCQNLDRSYDRLELSDIPHDSQFVTWARENGAAHDLQIVPRGTCPIADLNGGFDKYLSRLSANTRQQIRRLLRAATQAGVVCESAQTPAQAHAFFDEMVQLHQRRWEAAGQPGCFSSQTFTRFHRQLIDMWLPSGKVVLTRIRCGKTTLAVKYGFLIGSKFDFYQSGVRLDEDCPIRSPGIVSFMLLMQHLISRGVVTFDFLRGSSNYKQRLATTAEPLVMVRRVRWTLGTTMGFVVDLGARGIRRAGRLAIGRGVVSARADSR